MYPSNLSDQAWSEIEHILSVPTPGGQECSKQAYHRQCGFICRENGLSVENAFP